MPLGAWGTALAGARCTTCSGSLRLSEREIGTSPGWEQPCAFRSTPTACSGPVSSSGGRCRGVETAELLTSELATNAIVHGHTAFDVEVTLSDGTIRVTVTDLSEHLPVLLSPGLSDVHGRGLLILDQMADRWGTYGTGTGKQVWFDLRALD